MVHDLRSHRLPTATHSHQEWIAAVLLRLALSVVRSNGEYSELPRARHQKAVTAELTPRRARWIGGKVAVRAVRTGLRWQRALGSMCDAERDGAALVGGKRALAAPAWRCAGAFGLHRPGFACWTRDGPQPDCCCSLSLSSGCCVPKNVRVHASGSEKPTKLSGSDFGQRVEFRMFSWCRTFLHSESIDPESLPGSPPIPTAPRLYC